jgi:hypothetical protein
MDACQGKYLPLGSSKQDLTRAFFVDVCSVPFFLVAVCKISVRSTEYICSNGMG